MDEILKDSRVIHWLKKAVDPFLRGRLLPVKVKVTGWLSTFSKDFQEEPLTTAGGVLFVALGINLFLILLLRRTLSLEGISIRSLLSICALFLMTRKVDWRTLSSGSLLIQWLRRR